MRVLKCHLFLGLLFYSIFLHVAADIHEAKMRDSRSFGHIKSNPFLDSNPELFGFRVA
jgi:hypothetical protein